MASALNLLLKLGICAEICSPSVIRMKYSDAKAFFKNGGKLLCESIGEVKGVPGFLGRAKRSIAVVIALVIALAVYFLAGEVVWDVRTSGTENLSEYEVEAALREAGFGVGSLWRTVDKNRVETEVLSSSDKIGWISINRRGTVAYVDVREKLQGAEDGVGAGYTNIVADRTCVIESVTVTKGRAVVKAGDVVRAGDILISGIVEGADGAELCHAEGEVIGLCQDSILTVVKECEEVTSLSLPYTSELTLKFFNLNINIFKRYGNSDSEYAIMKNEESFVLFGRYRLPFGFSETLYAEKKTDSVTYSEEQMADVAKQRMNRQLHTLLGGGDLLKLRSEGELTENEYRLTTYVVYAVSVGTDSPIYAD